MDCNRPEWFPARSAFAFALAVFAALPAFALTVRTKGDLRLWETVTDRARPLSWTWDDSADTARLTFSNRLTHAVSSVTVGRESGAARGSCPHPFGSAADAALVDATLVQTADGVGLSCLTAVLAYVQGVGPGYESASRPITVRTKADRAWRRAERPSVAAFDARWWGVEGPSGYEVLWATPPGPHRVVREFDGAGLVDETVLRFGRMGFPISIR